MHNSFCLPCHRNEPNDIFSSRMSGLRGLHIVPLGIKGCICHFVKWQIHSFIAKVTIYATTTHLSSIMNSWLSVSITIATSLASAVTIGIYGSKVGGDFIKLNWTKNSISHHDKSVLRFYNLLFEILYAKVKMATKQALTIMLWQ